MLQPLRNLALKPLTTLGVAGTAVRAWRLDHLQQLDPLLEAVVGAGGERPPLVLGGGSNLLFARDIDEPLILVRLQGRRVLSDDGVDVVLDIAAGEVWDEIVRWSLAQGWFGLENLSLIPGLVGAAPWQNIGAYGVEVADRIVAVDAVNLRSGLRRRFTAADCDFGYRSSFFKTSEGRHYLILSVHLRLSRSARPITSYGEIVQELAAQAGREGTDRGDGSLECPGAPTPHQLAAAVRAIRRRKLPDPAVIGNAGSFFKNPIVPREQAESLKIMFPGMPVYPTPVSATQVKLSAGWLIDTAGWKGHRDGDAGVSAQHALVLVNHGNATGTEMLALARRIQQSVLERFSVALEPEPVIVC